MRARKKKIFGLGKFPTTGKGSTLLKSQVQWLASLAVTLKDIQEIGGQSVQMDREAFSDSMINTIFQAFPFHIQTELAKYEEDDGREILSTYLDFIAKLREKRQNMFKKLDGQEDYTDTPKVGIGD